jgi:hypothetical protein
MRSSLKLLTGCGFVAMLALMTTQRSAISRTRAANESLRQQGAASAALVNAPLQQVSNGEIDELQTANRELPKLRNEVRKLREDKRELERLQAENERLAATLKVAPKTSKPRLSEAEGFVLKENWSRAGFATPEATVQTFCWAAANRDMAALAECATAEVRKNMEKEMQKSAVEGKSFEEQFEPFAKMQGFRIGERKQISEDTVELSVQAAVGGRPLLMRLKLLNGEWKLAD